jgi:hypothetical protein
MRRDYCDDCRATRPFQPAFGWGTFFAVLVTLGGWLVALPFYPLRCRACGRPWNRKVEVSPESPPRRWGVRDWVVLVILLVVIISVIVFGIATGRFQWWTAAP